MEYYGKYVFVHTDEKKPIPSRMQAGRMLCSHHFMSSLSQL